MLNELDAFDKKCLNLAIDTARKAYVTGDFPLALSWRLKTQSSILLGTKR